MVFVITKRLALQRSWALWLAAAAVAVGLLHFTNGVYLEQRKHLRVPLPMYTFFPPSAAGKDISQIVPELWKPFIHDIDNATFVTGDGKERKISDGLYRWDSLRGKALIIDVDTRMGLSPGSVFGRQAGYLNHLLYALIHGYDYRLIQAPEYPGRRGTWVKVPFIKEALKSYDIVVFLDGDAIFEYPELPLEWMMSYWNITKDTLITLSKDPDSPKNRDQYGRAMHNTGFIIAQQSDRTQQMFTDWEDCPSGNKHPYCKRWAKKWAHEQGAFSNYIRYDYPGEDDVHSIRYSDANGPSGLFIRHNWFKKNAPVDSLYGRYSDDFIRQMQGYLRHEEKLFIDASDYTYPLHNLTML